MTDYQLQQGQFSGPLDKLLELVEARAFEITEISLSEVTADFLKYIRTLQEDAAAGPRLIADFIAVASRLILIKSKSLLPNLELTPEEEGDIRDLESRLRVYRELKPAMRLLQGQWAAGNPIYTRPYLGFRHFFLNVPSEGERVIYPGSRLTPPFLAASLRAVFAIFEKLQLETATVRDRIVTIEEKIHEIVTRLTEAVEARFRDLTDKKSRSEVVAIFLALLHLAREQLIRVEQQHDFSDIMITRLKTTP